MPLPSFPRKRESRRQGVQEMMMSTHAFVYIMASRKNGTIYVGVTNDLVRRVWEHKQGEVKGFTKRYGVHKLVYYEEHRSIQNAIQREKQIKKWNRTWKMRLIEQENLLWVDLYDAMLEAQGLSQSPE